MSDLPVPGHIKESTGLFCSREGQLSENGRCPDGCDHADHYSNDGHPECEENPMYACAECGTTTAKTYVVTTLDPNDPEGTTTEVCRACDGVLRHGLTDRDLELADVALESAVSATGFSLSQSDKGDTDSLNAEYRHALEGVRQMRG